MADYGVDCPIVCEEQTISETWYLSEVASADAIPIKITETEVKCDEVVKEETRDIDCEKLLAALRAMGYDVQSLNGLSGCNFTQKAASSIRGLGRFGSLRDGGDITTPALPVLDPALIRQTLASTCPDKNFDKVTDFQIGTVISAEIQTKGLDEGSLSRVVAAVCAMGVTKGFVPGLTQTQSIIGAALLVAGAAWVLTK